jgi:hypothetical protein
VHDTCLACVEQLAWAKSFASMLTSNLRRCVSCRVYFTAQASHLEHFACKFEESVDKAVGLALPQRHKLQAAALAKRFPVADMMQQYADAWLQVRGCRRGTLALNTLICPCAETVRMRLQPASSSGWAYPM